MRKVTSKVISVMDKEVYVKDLKDIAGIVQLEPVTVLREEVKRILEVGDHVIIRVGPDRERVCMINGIDGERLSLLPRHQRSSEEPGSQVSLQLIVRVTSHSSFYKTDNNMLALSRDVRIRL